VQDKSKHDNPLRVFKPQDDLVVSREMPPVRPDELTSIRRNEIASIAPDDINWNNIFLGKKHGLHSIKPETDSRKKGII